MSAKTKAMQLKIIIDVNVANKNEADATVDYFDSEVVAALEKIYSHYAGMKNKTLKNGSTKNGTTFQVYTLCTRKQSK